MRPFPVVAGWAAAVLGLALVHLAFGPPPLPVGIFVGAAVIVAAFGLAVRRSLRAGRAGPQLRQPVGAGASVLAAITVGVVVICAVYGWWSAPTGVPALLALYPLGLAVWLLRGERLRRGARPEPVVPDDAEPAGPPRALHRGSGLDAGTVEAADTAAGPEREAPKPPWWARAAALALAGARALRGRRR